jgi:molybdopterin/thiamine biosynthesis adenylyltransferase
MNEPIDISRHESVFNPNACTVPINIIGAGATGSHVFASLVNLGVTNIKIFDDDVVMPHNLANQIYLKEDIGKPKVTGCANYFSRKLGVETLPNSMNFWQQKVSPKIAGEGDTFSNSVVFLLTDTMDSRRDIFKRLIKRETPPLLIIETRMASTHGNIFTINPFDRDACTQWLRTLVDDNDEDTIELSPCGTTLSVGTTASLIANYAVWQMMQFFVDPISINQQIDLFFKPTMTVTAAKLAA